MRKLHTLMIRPTLFMVIVLVLFASSILASKPQIAYRYASSDPEAKNCRALVTIGYTDGADIGMTGEVWTVDQDGFRVKTGELELVDVDAYASVCQINGVSSDENIADLSIRIDLKDWSLQECLQRAGLAFSSGDYRKAGYYYGVINDKYPEEGGDQAAGRLEFCNMKVREKSDQALPPNEIDRRRGSIPVYYQLALRFFCNGEYPAAREYTEKILRVDYANKKALELKSQLDSSALPQGLEEAYQGEYPAPEQFVPVEKRPEMIQEFAPEFPEQAERDGAQGTVWIKALVNKDGTVCLATVGKSSGYGILDYTAVKAAYKNKYTPAEQQGKPVCYWMTYAVEFVPYPLASQ